jgi:hypothetical protein
MTKKIAIGLAVLAFNIFAGVAQAQEAAPAQKQGEQPAAKFQAKAKKAPVTAQELNLQEYVTLLRHNVRSEKIQLMGAVMLLDPDEAAKFWPIYRDYDGELTKLNDLRVANIEEYSKAYNDMTDEKADQLIRNAIQYQQQRDQLLAKYYGQVRDALGGITAARFLQVEHQLLLIIDLQIASSLPVVGS